MIKCFLNKNEAHIISLYLSQDNTHISFISESRNEILKAINPLITEKEKFILIDEKITKLLEGFIDDSYEGIFFKEFGKNMPMFDSLQRKLNYFTRIFKRKINYENE